MFKFLFFYFSAISLSFGNVFNELDIKASHLTPSVLNTIDSLLKGEENKLNFSVSEMKNDPGVDSIIPINTCFNFSFKSIFGEIPFKDVFSYSFTKINIPNLNNGQFEILMKKGASKLQVSFASKEFIPMNTYIGNSDGVEKNCASIIIPFFSNLPGLNDELSGLLIERDSMVKDVSPNSMNYKKAFLDLNYNVLNDITDSKYIVIYNLAPGNNSISIELQDKNVVSEFVHLISGEITLINDAFVEIANQNIKFYKNNLMSNKAEPKYFNNRLRGVFQQIIVPEVSKNEFKGINYIKWASSKILLQHDEKIVGKNLYYNVNSLNQNIVIPSNEYLNLFFEKNNIDPNDKFCVIEIPDIKFASSFNVSNSDGSSIESPDFISKDVFGNMSSKISKETDSIYIFGYMPGIIDYNISYQDGSHQYGQVPCGEDSYIIEQLL